MIIHWHLCFGLFLLVNSAQSVHISLLIQMKQPFTFTFMRLADAFIQSDLQLHSGYTFLISMCSLGIKPTTFCAADAMLYHWATQEHTFHWRKQYYGLRNIVAGSKHILLQTCSFSTTGVLLFSPNLFGWKSKLTYILNGQFLANCNFVSELFF